MTFELCTDSFLGAQLASQHGMYRIELCSGLSVGGLTPSYGLSVKCANIIETHAMIRPREGDFCYNAAEIEIMATDIAYLAKSGIRGVVFGCLTDDSMIDLAACIKLIDTSKAYDLEVTFHRAFDFSKSPVDSMHQLIQLGFDRILTSGQATTASKGKKLLQKLVENAEGKIQIIAGSGVNSSNAIELAALPVDALHFSSHRSITAGHGMGVTNIPDSPKIESIVSLFS